MEDEPADIAECAKYGIVQHAGPPKSPKSIIVRRGVMTSLNAPHPIRPPKFAALRPDTKAVAKDAVTISGESVPACDYGVLS